MPESGILSSKYLDDARNSRYGKIPVGFFRYSGRRDCREVLTQDLVPVGKDTFHVPGDGQLPDRLVEVPTIAMGIIPVNADQPGGCPIIKIDEKAIHIG